MLNTSAHVWRPPVLLCLRSINPIRSTNSFDPLQKKYEQFTGREVVLECTTNHYKAPVKWYKGDNRIEPSDKYQIDQDTLGKKFLRIQNCVITDSDEYSCRISVEEQTKTELVCTNKQYVFVKPLKSLRTTENETITLECEVDDSFAKVQWFKDGKELSAVPKKLDIIADGRKRKVIIKKCKVTDEGQYWCTTNADKTECETIVERMSPLIGCKSFKLKNFIINFIETNYMF